MGKVRTISMALDAASHVLEAQLSFSEGVMKVIDGGRGLNVV